MLKRLFLIFALIVAIGLLGVSSWHQWNDNKKTIVGRMEPIPPIAEFNHGSSIRKIAVSNKNPDRIASIGEDRIIKVWDRNYIYAPEITLEKYPTKYNVLLSINFMYFSQTSDWLLSKTPHMYVVWDISSGKIIYSTEFHSNAAAISPNGNLLAIGRQGLKLWDITQPNEPEELYVLPPKMNGQIISHDEARSKEHLRETYRQVYQVIDFSYDGKWIAMGGIINDEDSGKLTNNVKVWNFQDKQLFKIIETSTTNDLETKLNNDNENKRKAKVITDEGLQTIKVQRNKRNDIRLVKFSPDNRFLAVGAENGLTVWSLPELKIYHEWFDQYVTDVAFSPDGKILAVAGFGGIILWSIDSITPIAILRGRGFLTSVMTMEFSEDGRTLAGGGFDGLLWLWDVSDIYEN